MDLIMEHKRKTNNQRKTSIKRTDKNTSGVLFKIIQQTIEEFKQDLDYLK